MLPRKLAVAVTALFAVTAVGGALGAPAAQATDWTVTVRGTSRSPDPVFAIAVMPDTQQETSKPKRPGAAPSPDTRFVNRSNWLVANKKKLDLRFVTHVGDVVNWDTYNHEQYEVASPALKPLETAHIPYSLSIGNHDSQATGPTGGGARDPLNTHALQRQTQVFNYYFTAARYGAVKGAFEPNKVDNIYSTFTAGSDHWLVMNLELWPRVAVVDWARSVVASHPDFNVIVVTHSYLTSSGAIYTGADYGDTSPQYLFDNLIKVYPNVKMVFSGHVGIAGQRTDVGIHGNKIVSYLQTFHSITTNPVRLVEIDTSKGTAKVSVYAPFTNTSWPEYANTTSGFTFITPAR